MEEYIAAYKAYLASTRVKILAHFYRNMTGVQRFEVFAGLALTLLMIFATALLDHQQTAAIIAMVGFTALSLYMTFYVVCRNFRLVYLQFYLDYGDKMEFHADIYVRYLAFINQLRLENLYMVDDLKKIIDMIKTELDGRHIVFPMLNTLPRLTVTLLLTLLLGGIAYTYQGQLPVHPLVALTGTMVVLIIGSGMYTNYRKSIQLRTLKKFCRWAISDIEYETDFDGVEEEFEDSPMVGLASR